MHVHPLHVSWILFISLCFMLVSMCATFCSLSDLSEVLACLSALWQGRGQYLQLRTVGQTFHCHPRPPPPWSPYTHILSTHNPEARFYNTHNQVHHSGSITDEPTQPLWTRCPEGSAQSRAHSIPFACRAGHAPERSSSVPILSLSLQNCVCRAAGPSTMYCGYVCKLSHMSSTRLVCIDTCTSLGIQLVWRDRALSLNTENTILFQHWASLTTSIMPTQLLRGT